jgi:hypothetical protein
VRVACKSSVSVPIPGLSGLFFAGACDIFAGLDSFVSSSIHGLIDRAAPVKFGQGLLPANDKYLLGNEISATFNEDIGCNKPYTFTVSILLGTNPAQTLGGSDLSLYCEGRKIFIEVSSTALVQVCNCGFMSLERKRNLV